MNLIKKVLIVIISLFLFTGCEDMPEKGIYKEGTYYGFSDIQLGDFVYTTSAVIYVDNYGIIKSIFVDSTYYKAPIYMTTRKAMQEDLSNNNVDLSWNKQVELIEKKVLEEQDLNFIKWTDETKTVTDSIEGVNMNISDVYSAINNALSQAK